MADQMALLNNFISKIGDYGTALGWTPAQVTAAEELCTQIVTAIGCADGCKSTMQGVTQRRDMVLGGGPLGAAAGAPPAFPKPPLTTFRRGCVQQFMRLRDQIVANDGYTAAMGEALGLLGAEISPVLPESVAPSLKITVTDGDTVNVAGSMRGMNAMKMVYTPKGGEPREVAFITSTPAGFTISKADPAQPENGELRAYFYKKNLPYGNPSPNYPITLS